MKEKRYSIENVQNIVDISPTELQKLIKKNSRYLNLIREENSEGRKEIFFDEESLKRLLLLKQLERGGDISKGALCEIVKSPKMAAESKIETREDPLARVCRSLEAVSVEADQLNRQLQELVMKHEHVLKELNLVRAKNILLEKEIGILRNREAALMGHLRQNAENLDEEDLENQLFN